MDDKPKKYQDLTAEEKLRVIGWAIKGLYRITEEAVKNMAYSCAIADMLDRQVFDHEQIWELVPAGTQAHLVHMRPYVAALRCERDRILRNELKGAEEEVQSMFVDELLIEEDGADDNPAPLVEGDNADGDKVHHVEKKVKKPKQTPVAPKVGLVAKGGCRGR